MPTVHPTALVDPAARLHESVEIGAFSIVGPQVEIDAGTQVGSHVVLSGRTRIGRDNRFFSFSAIGGMPQDKKYAGEDTTLVIGNGNTIRESCTINLGTMQGGGATRIGNDNWIMAYVHIAHDVVVADHTIIANSVQIAGHAAIADWTVVGGNSGIHQFVRVGAHAMVGAGTILLQDLPPFVTCGGRPTAAHGINAEGLRRRGFDADALVTLKRAFKRVYREGNTVAEACQALTAMADETPEYARHVTLLRDFIAMPGRGIVR